MKKGRCIKSEDFLTLDKIYDVFEKNNGMSYVINDFNQETHFLSSAHDGVLDYYIGNWFEDAIIEIRNNKINKILKKKF